MPKVSRLEVIETGARRRWSLEEKLRIVAESERGPRQVSATARRHGLLPSQLFAWRKQAREGRLCADEGVAFAPAVIAREPDTRPTPSAAMPGGRIEILLRNGLRLVVDQAVDCTALIRIIGALDRG